MGGRTKIFIDAGHGGADPGAVGNGMRESDINFEVAEMLGELLSANGFKIMLSRPAVDANLEADGRLGISTRARMSNTWGADYFISIHTNAAGGTGAESFYWNSTAKKFSQTVLKTYCKQMALRNRRNEMTDRWGVIRDTNCPAILFELAFIDAPANKSDVTILRYRRREMAEALAKGVCNYFGIVPRLNTATAADGRGAGLNQTVRIKYRGRVTIINATNTGGRFITNFAEMAKVFPDAEIPVRTTLESAGKTVNWNDTTRTIVVT